MSLPPRAVVVTRPTELEDLLARHGTKSQARFFLESRGQRLEDTEARHAVVRGAVEAVLASIPLAWRRAHVVRSDLDRFLFEPEDVVACVGQDGLVANVAKYLSGQIVVGVNPGLYDGVLVRHRPDQARSLLEAAVRGEGVVEERTLVEATTSDGQRLRALNEIFIGHASHQSARYLLLVGEQQERHSSSGLLVASGTGATGWARSIALQRRSPPKLPHSDDQELCFFVREAFPSVNTGASLTQGTLAPGTSLEVSSEMEAGVLFGDGMEQDRIALPFGQRVVVRASEDRLRLLAAPS